MDGPNEDDLFGIGLMETEKLVQDKPHEPAERIQEYVADDYGSGIDPDPMNVDEIRKEDVIWFEDVWSVYLGLLRIDRDVGVVVRLFMLDDLRAVSGG